jgi:DNA-binding transcriptional LysR family regulator
MDLWQLNIFCKVVELKSFSKAGATLHLSQPTVSSHIKTLEDELGCRLLDRLAKAAIPTKAGELLYHYARRLIRLREEAETAMAEFHGAVRGHLTIGGSNIPGGYILPRIISTFTRRSEKVTVSLVVGDTQQIISAVASGDLEIGIVGARSSQPAISQEELALDEMRLIVPAHHRWAGRRRLQLAELYNEPFVIREKGSGTLKSLEQSLARQGGRLDRLHISAEMGSTQAVIQGIKSGAGVSILSILAVADELADGRLCAVSIDGLDLKRSFYLTRHKARSLSPLGRAFCAHLRKELRNGASAAAVASPDAPTNGTAP